MRQKNLYTKGPTKQEKNILINSYCPTAQECSDRASRSWSPRPYGTIPFVFYYRHERAAEIYDGADGYTKQFWPRPAILKDIEHKNPIGQITCLSKKTKKPWWILGTIKSATAPKGEEIANDNLHSYLEQYLSVDGELRIPIPSGYSNRLFGLQFGNMEVFCEEPPLGQYKIWSDISAWLRHFNRLKPKLCKVPTPILLWRLESI